VSAWTTGGSVPKVTLSLTTAPSSLAPKFTFNCTPEGKASCDLGTVDSTSARTQLKAQVAVAANATSVRSVKLTVTGSAPGLTTKKPTDAATITVKAASATASPSAGSTSAVPGTSTAGTPSAAGQVPATNVTSPLPVTSLPYLNSAAATTLSPSTLSPGGNASGLFPTLNPSGGAAANQKAGVTRTRSVADEASLRTNASVVGAQLAGLIALALAFILAVTRLSIRRRPANGKPTANGPK
jgi:hypothetical protein